MRWLKTPCRFHMLDKSILENIPQSTLEDAELNSLMKNIRENIEPEWRAKVKGDRDSFIESMTLADPEWVKERRVSYLKEEAQELMGAIYAIMDLVAEEGMTRWLAQLLFETEIKPRFKKVYSCNFQIKMWEGKGITEEMNLRYNTEVIKDRHSIVEVAGRYGIQLRKSGVGRFVGCCPWHQEKSASFMVYETKGDAHCYGCGAHVKDVIDLVMKMEKCDFKRACKILS